MREPQPRNYRNFVTLQRAVDTKDSTTGEFTQSWIRLADRNASIEPLNGREMQQAREIQADISHRLRMYADAQSMTLRPKDRIQFVKCGVTRIFNIVSVANLEERNRELEVMCKEQV